MTTLLDYSKGKWIKTKSVSKDAHTGFYLCKIESMEPQFTPFVMKISMLNIYPNGKMKIFLTKQEIEFIKSRFENVTIIVEKGYEFFPKELKYPFKDEMEHLYAWKEKETDENIKWCVKIFMNSLYGKTIQVSGDNQTGKLFNPIYAALITSGARIKLLETGVQNPESIIMFSTDAIHSTEKLKTPSHPSMGDFALDFTGEGVYIMSDVYNLWTDKKAKNKLRGFSLAMTKDIDSDTVMLKDILATMQGTKYSYTTKRPYHLGECLIHNKTRRIEDLNVFAEVKKNLDINGDKKRIWLNDFKSGKHCLKTQIDSFPILIE